MFNGVFDELEEDWSSCLAIIMNLVRCESLCAMKYWSRNIYTLLGLSEIYYRMDMYIYVLL